LIDIIFEFYDRSIKYLGDKRTTNDKFAPLEMTSKIHRKISKFGTQAPIVEKTLTSFERFYQAANKLDDNLIQKHGSQVAVQVKSFSSFVFLIIFLFLSGRCSNNYH
jgi:hypothetical protein